jgi:hypothetical protein
MARTEYRPLRARVIEYWDSALGRFGNKRFKQAVRSPKRVYVRAFIDGGEPNAVFTTRREARQHASPLDHIEVYERVDDVRKHRV